MNTTIAIIFVLLIVAAILAWEEVMRLPHLVCLEILSDGPASSNFWMKK